MVDERRRRAARTLVSLVCMVCGARNYKKNKPRRDGVPPLVLNKFCTHCQKHTEHREAK